MIDVDLDDVVTAWLSLPEVADAIGVPVSKVRDLIREGRLIAVEQGRPAVKRVPAEFVTGDRLVKGLAGAITVLRDAGYRDEEALRWLLTDDPAIPGRPVDAMAAGRDALVKRRAQSLAF